MYRTELLALMAASLYPHFLGKENTSTRTDEQLAVRAAEDLLGEVENSQLKQLKTHPLGAMLPERLRK